MKMCSLSNLKKSLLNLLIILKTKLCVENIFKAYSCQLAYNKKSKYSFNINFMQHKLTIVNFMWIIFKLKQFLIIHS